MMLSGVSSNCLCSERCVLSGCLLSPRLFQAQAVSFLPNSVLSRWGALQNFQRHLITALTVSVKRPVAARSLPRPGASRCALWGVLQSTFRMSMNRTSAAPKKGKTCQPFSWKYLYLNLVSLLECPRSIQPCNQGLYEIVSLHSTGFPALWACGSTTDICLPIKMSPGRNSLTRDERVVNVL